MKRNILFLLILCVVALFKNTEAQTQTSGGVTAFSANDFLNSIGANSAVSRRGETLPNTINCTKYLGLRWFRAGYESDIPTQDLIDLHLQTGARFSYGLASGGTDIQRLLSGGRQLATAGALLAFEGNNEPNNWGITYQGESGGKRLSWLPVAKLQSDLYKAVKSDPALKNYPVWSITENGAETDNVGLQYLTIPNGAGTLMPDGTQYADFANVHNYIGHPSLPNLVDNLTWNVTDPSPACKVDGLYGNYGLTWAKHFTGYSNSDLLTLPRVTTETGRTIVEGETSEHQQACLFLTMYLDQFKRGWSYTAIYLLRDRSDEAGNQQFGFYKKDYTPRKSAVYLHNLTTILADSGTKQAKGKLNYSIVNQPTTTHDLLLQKSNGNFELVVWSEKISGSDNIAVNLGRKYRSVKIYDPTIGTSMIQTLKNVNTVTLTMSDHPLIIEFDK
jgi:hypothetical protein